MWGRPTAHSVEGKGFFLALHLLNVSPKSRLIIMPRLYAATFAATRISSPHVLWAPGYLSPKLSVKFAKVVSTTWRAELNQRRSARGAALGSGQTWAP